jgi:hypothetical protein
MMQQAQETPGTNALGTVPLSVWRSIIKPSKMTAFAPPDPPSCKHTTPVVLDDATMSTTAE